MPRVTVQPFDHTYECDDTETLLEGALRNDLYVRYGCKHGGCGTCKARLVDGEVDETRSTFALSRVDRDEGWILMCSSVPVDDCLVDVSGMDLTEDEFFGGDQIGTYLTLVEKIEELTPDIRGLRLRLVDPPNIKFVAGQFVNVELPDSDEVRSFSLANPPSRSDVIDLIIKMLPGGRFAQLLNGQLSVGDKLRVYGPLGQMKVRLSHRPIVMIAGGSGLAPFLSMLTELAEQRSERPVTLFFGARRAEDLYALDRIAELQRRMPALRFIPALSEERPADWHGETGLVTDVVARCMPDLSGHDAYLAGPPPMIDAAVPLLVKLGVRERNIHFDAFVPSGGA